MLTRNTGAFGIHTIPAHAENNWIIEDSEDDTIDGEVHMDSGHAGASGRFDFLKEVALDVAFALMVFKK